MSRLDIESEYYYDARKVYHEFGSNQMLNKPLHSLDPEIAQLTKLKSGPHERLSKPTPLQRNYPVSTVKMLAGRERNLSGRGRFTSADCRHMLSRYIPVNGPWLVEQMTSRTYTSHFSADGSLLVTGFQV